MNYSIPGLPPASGTPTTYNPQWQSFWGALGRNGASQRWNNYYSGLPDWQKDAVDRDPETGWATYTTIAGGGMPNNFQRWLGNNFSRYYGQFNTVPGGDPSQWWGQYIGQINPYADFMMADPIARGERQNLLTNTMRMVR